MLGSGLIVVKLNREKGQKSRKETIFYIWGCSSEIFINICTFMVFKGVIQMDDENIIEDLNDEDISIIKKYKENQKRLISQKMDLYIPSLKDMIQNKIIILDPKFQRRDRWNKKQQSKLIESIIMAIPIPPIFLAEEEYNNYTVMDGKQRLTAINMFLNNGFSLTGLIDWPELNDKTFDELNNTIQNAITRRAISAIVIQKESDLDIKFDVFERINTGGEHLNPQEVRNCIYRGAFNDLIIKLSQLRIFRDALGMPEDEEELKKTKTFQQMDDAQLVLRFFRLQNYEKISGNLKTSMNEYMEKSLKFTPEELNKHENLFLNTIERVYGVYKKLSFRKWNPFEKEWVRISGPFYDAVMHGFSKVSVEQIKGNEKKIIAGTKKLFEDDDFVDSIKKGTNSLEANKIRITKFGKMLKSAVE